MFFPAYQLDSFKTEQEALKSADITSEDLKHSIPATVISGDVPENCTAKMIAGDGVLVFSYNTDGRVSVWFSDDYWECPTITDAQELITSVEDGISAEFWAIFEVMNCKSHSM